MDFELDDDQLELQRVVRDVVDRVVLIDELDAAARREAAGVMP